MEENYFSLDMAILGVIQEGYTLYFPTPDECISYFRKGTENDITFTGNGVFQTVIKKDTTYLLVDKSYFGEKIETTETEITKDQAENFLKSWRKGQIKIKKEGRTLNKVKKQNPFLVEGGVAYVSEL